MGWKFRSTVNTVKIRYGRSYFVPQITWFAALVKVIAQVRFLNFVTT